MVFAAFHSIHPIHSIHSIHSWWNDIKEDGSNEWVFEAGDPNTGVVPSAGLPLSSATAICTAWNLLRSLGGQIRI